MVGKVRWPGANELAAPVAELREQVRTLQAENAQLRAELAARSGAGGASGGSPVAGAETAQVPTTRKTRPA